MLSHDLSDLLSRELFPDSALKTLGTVDKLTVQIAKNGFSSVRKKTQPYRAKARLFDDAIGKPGKQDVQINYIQVLTLWGAPGPRRGCRL